MFEVSTEQYKYVNRPVQAYAGGIAELNNRYDKAVEQKSIIDMALSKMPAGTKADREKLTEVANTIKGSINKYIQGGDYSNMDIVARELATSFMADPVVTTIASNAEKVEQAQKLMEAAKFQGKQVYKNFIDVRDEDGNIKTVPQTDYDHNTFSSVGADGSLRTFNNPYVVGLDYSDKMRQLIGNIQADGGTSIGGVDLKASGLTSDDIQTLKNAYLQKRSFVGVSQDKVDRLIKALLPAYLQSDEGKQDVMTLKSGQRALGTSSIKLGSDVYEGISADILSRMRGVAQPQVGGKSDIDFIGMPTRTSSGGSSGSGNDVAASGASNWYVENILFPNKNRISEADAKIAGLSDIDLAGNQLVFKFSSDKGDEALPKNTQLSMIAPPALGKYRVVDTGDDSKPNVKKVDGKPYILVRGFVSEDALKVAASEEGKDYDEYIKLLKKTGLKEAAKGTAKAMGATGSEANSTVYQIEAWTPASTDINYSIKSHSNFVGTSEDSRSRAELLYRVNNDIEQRQAKRGIYMNKAAKLFNQGKITEQEFMGMQEVFANFDKYRNAKLSADQIVELQRGISYVYTKLDSYDKP